MLHPITTSPWPQRRASGISHQISSSLGWSVDRSITIFSTRESLHTALVSGIHAGCIKAQKNWIDLSSLLCIGGCGSLIRMLAHPMAVEIGRHLLMSSGPTSAQTDTWSRFPRVISVGLWRTSRRLHNSQPLVPTFCHSSASWWTQQAPRFQWISISLGLVLGTTGSIHFTAPYRDLWPWIGSPWASSAPGSHALIREVLQVLQHLCGLPLDSFQSVPVSSYTMGPRTGSWLTSRGPIAQQRQTPGPKDWSSKSGYWKLWATQHRGLSAVFGSWIRQQCSQHNVYYQWAHYTPSIPWSLHPPFAATTYRRKGCSGKLIQVVKMWRFHWAS